VKPDAQQCDAGPESVDDQHRGEWAEDHDASAGHLHGEPAAEWSGDDAPHDEQAAAGSAAADDQRESAGADAA